MVLSRRFVINFTVVLGASGKQWDMGMEDRRGPVAAPRSPSSKGVDRRATVSGVRPVAVPRGPPPKCAAPHRRALTAEGRYPAQGRSHDNAGRARTRAETGAIGAARAGCARDPGASDRPSKTSAMDCGARGGWLSRRRSLRRKRSQGSRAWDMKGRNAAGRGTVKRAGIVLRGLRAPAYGTMGKKGGPPLRQAAG